MFFDPSQLLFVVVVDHEEIVPIFTRYELFEIIVVDVIIELNFITRAGIFFRLCELLDSFDLCLNFADLLLHIVLVSAFKKAFSICTKAHATSAATSWLELVAQTEHELEDVHHEGADLDVDPGPSLSDGQA